MSDTKSIQIASEKKADGHRGVVSGESSQNIDMSPGPTPSEQSLDSCDSCRHYEKSESARLDGVSGLVGLCRAMVDKVEVVCGEDCCSLFSRR